jgi:hypothetical protein
VNQDDISAWALANGWQLLAGCPSLMKPGRRAEPIVRIVFKTTVASLEVRRATKWEKVASAKYDDIMPDADGDRLLGLGFEKVPSLSMLMRDNRDAQVFARFGK